MKTIKELPLFIYINTEGDYIESTAKLNADQAAAYAMLSMDGQTVSIYDEADNLIAEMNAEEDTHFNYELFKLETNNEKVN